MNYLDDLMLKYKADKTPLIKHHYTDTYFELFNNRRQVIKKVLEIGTAEGASLYAWRDFFPNATIFGGEIEQERVDMMKNKDRIRVFKCDQSNEQNLKDLIYYTNSDLDLVIDDGSHVPLHQLFTCFTVFPLLNLGATYIIEDVDEASASNLFVLISKQFPKNHIEMITVGERHDDRLIICQK